MKNKILGVLISTAIVATIPGITNAGHRGGNSGPANANPQSCIKIGAPYRAHIGGQYSVSVQYTYDIQACNRSVQLTFVQPNTKDVVSGAGDISKPYVMSSDTSKLNQFFIAGFLSSTSEPPIPMLSKVEWAN